MSIVASSATLLAMSTMASDVADPVRVVVRQPSAMRNAPSPISDTVRADQSSRKSRLRKAYSARTPPSRLGSVRPRGEAILGGRGAPVGSPSRRRLHACLPGPELGPEAYRALAEAHGLRLDLGAVRGCPGRGDRRPRAASRARSRRGGLGALHRGHRPGHGRRRARRWPPSPARSSSAGSTRVTSSSTTTSSRCSRS